MFVISDLGRSRGCKAHSISSRVEVDSGSVQTTNSVQSPFTPHHTPTVGRRLPRFIEKRSRDEVVLSLGLAHSIPSLGPITDLTMRVHSLSNHPGLCYQHNEGLGWSTPPNSHRRDTLSPADYDHKLSDDDERMWQGLVGNEIETNSGDSEAGDIASTSCPGRSDQGHRATLHNQTTTGDPLCGLMVGPAPDQTLRTIVAGEPYSIFHKTEIAVIKETWLVNWG